MTKKRKHTKRTTKKIHVVAVFIVVCSLFFDVWLYHTLKELPPRRTAALSSGMTGTTIPPGKNIYLTFDMDMDTAMYQEYRQNKALDWYDPALFAYLESNHIQATFFASGLFIQAYPDLIKSLAGSGLFSFQNHSYDESSFVPDCYWLATLTDDGEKINQIEATEDLIKATTGQTATYFRFPGICHDVVNDALVRHMGLVISDGTIVSGDPFNDNAPAIVQAVISQAKENAVVIMHVGGPNAPKSLTALEQIVPRLEQEGYSFGKLP